MPRGRASVRNIVCPEPQERVWHVEWKHAGGTQDRAGVLPEGSGLGWGAGREPSGGCA